VGLTSGQKLDNQWVWLQDKCWTISGFDFRTNVGQSVGLMLCLIIIILLIGHLIFVDNAVVGKLCHFDFHLTKWSAHLNDSRDKMISSPQWFQEQNDQLTSMIPGTEWSAHLNDSRDTDSILWSAHLNDSRDTDGI
jgi:hypothetical protein